MEFRVNRNFYIKKRNSLIKELSRIKPFITGSLVKIKRKCGKECECKGGKRHTNNYLADKVSGKTRLVYIPDDLVDEVTKWKQEYQLLKSLIQEVSELQRIIIKKYVGEKRRRKKAMKDYQEFCIKQPDISSHISQNG